MTDATILERFDLALTRIETAADRLRDDTRRADARFATLDTATAETLAALDALIAAPAAPAN